MASHESEKVPTTTPGKIRSFFNNLKIVRFVVDQTDLIVYKVFCFLIYGSYGALYPYLPLYFKQLGLGAHHAGTIVGIRPLVQCLGAPFWGTVADRYKAGHLILMGGVMAWLMKAFLILAVQPQNQQCIEVYINISGNSSETLIYARNLWKTNVRVKWVTIPLAKKPVIIHEHKLVKVEIGGEKISPSRKPTAVLNQTGILSSEPMDLTKYIIQRFDEIQSNNTEVRQKRKANDLPVFKSSFTNNSYNNNTAIQHQGNKLSTHKDKKSVFQPKQALENVGKVITYMVSKFDKSLNSTVVFATQLDRNELYHLFVIFTLFMVIGEFLESPTYTLSDSSLLSRLGEQVDKYGLIRMFGSLGAAIAVAVVGAIIYSSRFEMCAILQQNYLAAFYIYIALASGAFFTVLGFTFEYNEEATAEPAFKETAALLLRPRCLSFMGTAWFAGMCFGFLFHYVNWYIDDLHGHAFTMGVAGAAREFSGICFFFFGGHVLKLIGYVNCLACGLIAYITVLFSYSVLTIPWFAVALETVSGGTYALIWSSCIGYFNTVGRSVKNRASLQGILQGVFWGLGNGGGTIVGGTLYHHFGSTATFRAFGTAGLVVLAVFVLVQRFCRSDDQEMEKASESYEAVASEDKDDVVDSDGEQSGLKKRILTDTEEEKKH